MVNSSSTTKASATSASATSASDRRERTRAEAQPSGLLGQAKLNPFGDLNTLQHLSARLARSLRAVWEPLVRAEVRSWAEPLVVQRFADYRSERPDRLTAWLPMAITAPPSATGPHHAGGQAMLVLDGRFALELLDLFFGGTGAVHEPLPTEFTPAAEAMITRLGMMVAEPLTAAWEPVTKLAFTPGRPDANPAMLGDIDADDAMIVTRFGVGYPGAKPVFVDIVYPVAAMKPHGTALTGKVVAKAIEKDEAWQAALTRSAMQIRFPVRSVLAEPTISLAKLMDLKPGDVIPIAFTNDVPVMVGRDRLGCGTVGTSNGHAAIQLTKINRIDEGFNA